MEMKFRIDDTSKLTITDDKKEIVFMTDKADLQVLMKTIQEHLNKEDEKKEIYGYGYNPRTKRLEPLGQ